MLMATMMSSGKSSSSSVAAVVLLVAAVVAGTCASGAEAQFDLTNLCNKTLVLTTATGASTLPPGGTLHVNVSASEFFVAPVTVTIVGTGSPPVNVTIPIPQFVLNIINLLSGLGVQLQSIEIRCEGNCVTIFVTLPSGPIPLGPFCL